MTYNPDGDPHFDLNDPESVDRFLNDPTAGALAEDLGRAFRALPPEEQIEDLAVQRMSLQNRRDELAALLEEADPTDGRFRLLEALDGHLDAYARRIAEVRDQAV